MNVTLKPGAATDDARQIDMIIQKISDSMAELNQAMNRAIPNGVKTTWSLSVKDNWDKYYTADVPATLEDMKLSATNLRAAIEQVLSYDREDELVSGAEVQ